MPVSLDKTLIDPTDQSTKHLLGDLQGNILKGHGRPHSLNIFVSFLAGKTDSVKGWLTSFADTFLTTADEQWTETKRFKETGVPGNLFINMFLTSSGYKYLGIPDARTPSDPQFRAGMKASGHKLNDPAPATWHAGFANDIHAMFLVADESPQFLRAFKRALIESLKGLATIQKVQPGRVIRNEDGNGIEHNGYADGVSQPLFFKGDVADETSRIGTTNWHPEAPLNLALVHDPGGSTDDSCGSYFVFRKLEQNVQAFKSLEEAVADKLGLDDEDRERAGALVVGRFENGTPLILHNAEQDVLMPGHPNKDHVPNDFSYKSPVNDGGGAVCPFHGHIRKTNPRSDSFGMNPGEDGTKINKPHRIVRRGIPFEDKVRPRKDGIIDEDFQPTGKVGLLFMCFQSNLENQFEFMQSAWANEPAFVQPNPQTGIDPIIGQVAPGTGTHNRANPEDPTKPDVQLWRKPDGTTVPFSFAGTVTMRGGAYFFAPSLSFFQKLKPGAGLTRPLDVFAKLDTFLNFGDPENPE
jgi:Dyp-type peroxidase family